ncbi:MAG TPA: hypothetical protein VGG32_03735 [Thermoplasmata archaeon]|jgi:hypothetical protein
MLTAILREREDVANALAALVDYRPSRDRPPIQAFPRSDHYALVGTAFDYLLRWELERRNPSAVDREWVATTTVTRLLPLLGPEKIDPFTKSLYVRVHDEAEAFHRRWLELREPTPNDVIQAARIVLCLAKIDPLYRAGVVLPDVYVFDPRDVEDIETLYSIAPWEVLGGARGASVLLNPDYGVWSRRLDGADADLVVGSTLVDLKTSKYNDIEKHFPQLVGYYALGELYRQDEPSYPEVERAGIYWCRHGYLETFDTAPIRENPGYERAVTALLEAADEISARKRAAIEAASGLLVSPE